MAKKKEEIPVEKAVKAVVTEKTVVEAFSILQEYKKGKANLEAKVIANEQWWKLRHWDEMQDNSGGDKKSVSAWLFNNIVNKHADAMDNMPSPAILPREANDKAEADRLSAIIPAVMEYNDFEQTYNDGWFDKLISGTAVYGVFWDRDKLNGLGDIDIRQQELLNIFWEPGIKDIQRSKNIFTVELVDNAVLESTYPETAGKLSGDSGVTNKYQYDDTVDTSDKSAVIDWYYKKNVGGKTILHYVKFVNDVVLFATENEPDFAEVGWYDHGLYPFVFDPLYKVKGTPCGFSCVDVSKSPQERVDNLNQAIDKTAVLCSRTRFFARADAGVNLEDFSDPSKDIVNVKNLGEDVLKQIVVEPMPAAVVTVQQNTIEELKETSGNRDFSQGSTASGVTSGAAIAALQEAGSKLSRDMIKGSYRAYRDVVYFVVELIRQFYDEPREFRILGKEGQTEFTTYDNSQIKPQLVGDELMGEDYRSPLFDISIRAQKESPYARVAQNELALSLYGQGFFNPEMAEQALVAVDMMEFEGKAEVVKKISENAAKYQAMLQQQQMIMQQQAMMGGNISG